MIYVHELTTGPDIAAAFPLMAELRPNLQAESFLDTVRRQQRDGYRLYGGSAATGLVVLAGVRDAHTLVRGPHLFIDDLVTLPSKRGTGYGTAMLRWLAGHAAGKGLPRIYLDSRDTALGFYRGIGFEALTSVPCWIDVGRLGAGT